MKKSDLTVAVFFMALGISLFLFSCVNQKSVARWVEKNGGSVKIDSVFVTDIDSFITERVEIDTIFKSTIGDTVYLQKDRLKIKYVQLPGDSIYIEGVSEADTVIQYKDRWVGNNITVEKPLTTWDKVKMYSLPALLSVILLYALLVIFRRKNKQV